MLLKRLLRMRLSVNLPAWGLVLAQWPESVEPLAAWLVARLVKHFPAWKLHLPLQYRCDSVTNAGLN